MSLAQGVPSVRALVIGAGISGLTTALCLRRRNVEVTIVAEKFLSQTTTVIAGALWEWPPAVCGFHQNLHSLKRSKSWARHSYDIFAKLCAQPETGVSMRNSLFFFRSPVASKAFDLQKMEEIQRNTLGFRHDPALIEEYGVNRAFGLEDAYMHLAPTIDTDRYINWLWNEVEKARVKIIHERIAPDLYAQHEDLKRRFHADVIINCSGLGARELVEPEVYPLRGALIRIVNDGKAFPKIDEAYCVTHDDALPGQNMIYIIPRGEGTVLLGGLAEPNKWDLSINWDNYEPIGEMWRRCTDFLPRLKNGKIDEMCSLKTGLRPMRPENVRVEIDDYGLAHNYGHGGSGVTFSWGCAEELAEMIFCRGSEVTAQVTAHR